MLRKILPLRRMMRRVIVRCRGSAKPSIHRPELSEQAFAAFLVKIRLIGNASGNISDTSQASAGMRDAALEFRERIGKRFFVHPDSVNRLCQEAYRSHPAWRNQLANSVTELLNSGLPVYGRPGPRLTGGFPWLSLPLGPGGDSLYPFRAHRFAFLPRLALAVFQEIIPPACVLEIVESWMAEAATGRNPFCYGTNLVVIQRMLATIWAWVFLAARPPSNTSEGLGLESRLLRILWTDAQFLKSRLGASVANNHLLVDQFAAVFLQTVLPEFLARDDRGAEDTFRDELLRQTYEDGGGFEHSTHYHEFACEMGAAYLLLCRRQGRSADEQIKARVAAMLYFHSALAGPDAIPLPIGNATEDPLFPLDDGGGWCPGALRELYRSLFKADIAPAPVDDASVERAFWLLGGDLRSFEENTEDSGILSFPKAGFHLYPDNVLGGQLIFRTGPDEDAPVVAGHMHADLLSVYLSLNGHPVLVDAGTYSYRGPAHRWPPGTPAWRPYLAGPAAHNTLTIEGYDPLGPIQGDFRRFDIPARVSCQQGSGAGLSWSEGRLLHAGPYSGYTRGCIHVPGCYWIIYDRLPLVQGNGGRKRWYGFQFAPGVRIQTRGGTTTVDLPNDAGRCWLVTNLPDAPLILEGSTDPLGGWVSPRYGEILPAPQLRYPLGLTTSVFVFTTQSGTIPAAVHVEPLLDRGLAIRLATEVGEDLLILNDNPDTVQPLRFEGLNLEGRLLWVKIANGETANLRWLDSQRVD